MTGPNRDEIRRLELLTAAHPEGRLLAHLAEAYRKAGDLDRALETVRRGLERHPELPVAHMVHGRILADRDRPAEARAAFQRALRLDPENRAALRDLQTIEQRPPSSPSPAPSQPSAPSPSSSPWPASSPSPTSAPASSRSPSSWPSSQSSESDSDPPLVTATLAELYERQGLTEHAAALYRELERLHPNVPLYGERSRRLGRSGAGEAAAPGLTARVYLRRLLAYGLDVEVEPRRAPSHGPILVAWLDARGAPGRLSPAAPEAIARLADTPAELVLISDDLPDDGALRAVHALRRGPNADAVLVVVDADRVERRIELLEAGADVCFPRDVRFDELRATVHALMRRACGQATS